MSLPRTGDEIIELLDSLLWISPLLDILQIAYSVHKEPRKETISFKVEQQFILDLEKRKKKKPVESYDSWMLDSASILKKKLLIRLTFLPLMLSKVILV